MSVRRAAPSDLEDMTWVLLGASPDDPVYAYRYPGRNQFPEDFALHCRLRCSEYLATSTVVVYEVRMGKSDDQTKVVAFGVWDPPRAKRSAGATAAKHHVSATVAAPVPVRRDAHPGRVKAFSSQSAEAKSRFFDTRYGGRGHMFLRILLCHPDYRRRGAGSELVQWGLKRAVARGLDATLFSSPMGYSLYRQLGFRECGRFLCVVIFHGSLHSSGSSRRPPPLDACRSNSMAETPPVFATPLAQSPRSDILEWRFPKPFHSFVLTGKSRAAWHTSFMIPQLNLLLDAGLCINHQRPKHIFLTHGHNDHAMLATAFVKRDDPPDIYCPAEMEVVFDSYIRANRLLNLGGLVTLDEICRTGEDSEGGDGSEPDEQAVATTPAKKGGVRPTHITHGLRPGDTVTLPRIKAQNITATAFACDHSVPCLGYVFSITTDKLRPEYTGLSGQEIKRLRVSGTSITAPKRVPIFAFLGDTTAATLAAAPEWLVEGVAVVVTECSFLYEEHRRQAEKTKHTLWSDLEPVIRKWPKTTFVITHFSLRYKDMDK
ncbi:hypothetical protein P8C59_004596 [Phyllachora maydis]|uniref:N-acetyltransferase domain-containing protein n=1 Tax=Phyllachora maydis TaxID=1825666 RepID=A0AAD9I317_9PEZI|nr:hypothetical protein P8C59_004596 [Phyllachora maydis]